MGLNQRRKVKELQDTLLPGRVKEIQEICGKGTPTTSIGAASRMTPRHPISSTIFPVTASTWHYG